MDIRKIKKLIESGSFRASMKVWKEGKDWFAGLYPGSKGSEGQDLEIVGAVHEDGALVPISDPIRKFFAAKGFPLRGELGAGQLELLENDGRTTPQGLTAWAKLILATPDRAE